MAIGRAGGRGGGAGVPCSRTCSTVYCRSLRPALVDASLCARGAIGVAAVAAGRAVAAQVAGDGATTARGVAAT